MSRLAEILRMQALGLSQDAIGLQLGITQSLVSETLKRAGLSKPRSRRPVNRARRDGTVSVAPVEVWEPYHILDPGVRKFVSERYFTKPSNLRTNLARRRWFGINPPTNTEWTLVGRVSQ